MFDVTCIILLPSFVLIKSQKDFPALWSDYVIKKKPFYATTLVMEPRRETPYMYKDDLDQKARQTEPEKERIQLREIFQERKVRKQNHMLGNTVADFVTVDIN